MIVCMPYKYSMNTKVVKAWSCNFLAVHKDLRNKRLAPIVIGEALRKSRIRGPPTALNTSFHSYPSPVVTCAPLNRFLNPEKCREIGYANVQADYPMDKYVQRFRLPKKENIDLKGVVRSMVAKDVHQVLEIFNNHQKKYKIGCKWSQEDCLHFLLPREGVV